MLYGYARVSTRGQAKDGNSLEAQENALRLAGATKVYAHADTETKRKAIEKAISSTSPTEKISQTAYKVEDEEMLKRLYGLK